MNSLRDDHELDSLFREALQPYTKVTPPRDVFPGVLERIGVREPFRKRIGRALTRFLTPIPPCPPAPTIRVKSRYDYHGELDLLPNVSLLAQQLITLPSFGI